MALYVSNYDVWEQSGVDRVGRDACCVFCVTVGMCNLEVEKLAGIDRSPPARLFREEVGDKTIEGGDVFAINSGVAIVGFDNYALRPFVRAAICLADEMFLDAPDGNNLSTQAFTQSDVIY